MPGYVLIPFAVFFGCCVAQFWFMNQVRDRLIEQHPDTFLAVEKSSFFPSQGVWRFMRKGRYKSLKDAELDRRVRNFNRLQVVGLVAWLAYGIALFTAPLS